MKYCCEKVLLEKVLLNQLKHDKDNLTIKKFSNFAIYHLNHIKKA